MQAAAHRSRTSVLRAGCCNAVESAAGFMDDVRCSGARAGQASAAGGAAARKVGGVRNPKAQHAHVAPPSPQQTHESYPPFQLLKVHNLSLSCSNVALISNHTITAAHLLLHLMRRASSLRCRDSCVWLCLVYIATAAGATQLCGAGCAIVVLQPSAARSSGRQRQHFQILQDVRCI